MRDFETPSVREAEREGNESILQAFFNLLNHCQFTVVSGASRGNRFFLFALERSNKDLLAANPKLAQQLEAAYQKVQDIAAKTVEGSSQAKALPDLQKLLVEQSRN